MSEYIDKNIQEWYKNRNMCRVFELPERFPSDYCFGGGHDVTFKMVDWYNPIPPITTDLDRELLADMTWNDIKQFNIAEIKKQYFKKDRGFLVITAFGEAFLVI